MTEHEQLKEICDKISFKTNLWVDEKNGPEIFLNKGFYKNGCRRCGYILCDVREIIFTQEFMDKFISYISEKEILTSSIEEHNIYYNLMKNNLNNLVKYLANLLGIYE